MIEKLANLIKPVIKGLDFLSPLIDLTIRLWVGIVFFKSGLVKISSMDSTIALFENEYEVPLLPPELAAYLGTAAELTLPWLLFAGFATRFGAAALFIFNIVAVISYPGLSEVGLKDHYYWGLLMLVPLLHGPGKLSLDYFIARKYLGQAH